MATWKSLFVLGLIQGPLTTFLPKNLAKFISVLHPQERIMHEDIINLVKKAIVQVNRENEGSTPIQSEMSTILFGSDSQLDSLGLINLIVAVEQQVEEKFGTAITLADDRALSQEVSPFSTVQTLVDYIEVLMKEKGHA